MLDGFDEISPFYNETVIDLLQGLRLKVIKQLCFTIRPHPRENLEVTIQQLPYKLEPFSAEDQVELRIKFWSLKDWFTEINTKEKEESKISYKFMLKD
jgi:hypothetical protein